MKLDNLILRDFRNYETLELTGLGDLTVFVGENAVGKTNIIEGIQLLTSLSSFRHGTMQQLMRAGTDRSRLETVVTDGHRRLDLDLTLTPQGRRYRLNGKAKRPVDLKGLVPSVIFTPDDLELVKGSQSVRRRALDNLGSQVHRNYYQVRRDYEKVIRHKNHLLKEEASNTLIDSINEMLITCGSQLGCFRTALFSRLAPSIESHYAQISRGRETLKVTYEPHWSTRDEARGILEQQLSERSQEERRRKRSLVGPHTDEIHFTLNGADATAFGSQGQQRSIVLSCKLAEAAVIEDLLEQKPVLLLDDVMSELDGPRREALVALMEKGTQTFLTTANLAYFDNTMLDAADVISLPLESRA